MKSALCAAMLCAGALAALAAESATTAYTALRVVGKKYGSDSLNRVVELKGRYGAPEPDVWKITLDEPSARGGLREVEVQHGQINGDKTPVARPVNARINFNLLNLDSEGVFTVVNAEMQKAGVNFDRADYLLKTGTGTGSSGRPVWHIDLFGQNTRVAEFDVAADDGKVMHRDLELKSKPRTDDRTYTQTQPTIPPPPRLSDPTVRRTVPPPARDTYVDRRPVRPDDYDSRAPAPPPDTYVERRTSRGEEYDDRTVVRRTERRDYYDDPEYDSDGTPFVDKVGRHFEKRGRQFKNFFTGRGWTDQ